METLIAVIHIVVALVLIALILVQDSKSGSVGGAFGGGGSNSILGATGATTLAQKATRVAAVVFAFTCIGLSVFSARTHRSVLEGVVTNAPAPATSAPTSASPAPAAADAPAAPAEAPPTTPQ